MTEHGFLKKSKPPFQKKTKEKKVFVIFIIFFFFFLRKIRNTYIYIRLSFVMFRPSFCCCFLTSSPTSTLAKLVNLSNSPVRLKRQQQQQHQQYKRGIQDDVTVRSSASSHKNDDEDNTIASSSPSSSPLQRYWPPKVRLTGRVVVSDAAYVHNNNNNNNNGDGTNEALFTPGDIRLRKQYYCRDASSDDSDILGIGLKSNHNNNNLEYYSDRGKSQRSFQIAHRSSGAGTPVAIRRQSSFFREASNTFKSMEDFGSRYHQLDGHELVDMQGSGKGRLMSVPVGGILIDVFAVPQEKSSTRNCEQQQQQQQKQHQQGYWVKLSGAVAATGVSDSTFKSVEDALSIQQRFQEFLQMCGGVHVYTKLPKHKRGRNEEKEQQREAMTMPRIPVDPTKNFRGYFFHLETDTTRTLDQSWLTKRKR